MEAPADLRAQLAAYREETEARCARLKRTDTIKGLFINGYLRAWARQACSGSGPLLERCLAALGETAVHDLYSYPYANLLRMGLVGAEALAGRAGGVATFLRETGRQATAEYLGSPLGRAFLALLPNQPRAVVGLMPWAIRTTFTFGERSMRFDGPTHGVFSCRFDYSPAEANAGAVEAALLAAGARSASVAIERFDLFNFDLLVRWDE